jgi:hypothetical protein
MFSEVYINLEKFAIHYLNFLWNPLISIYSGKKGARSSWNILTGAQAIKVWEPLV